MLLGAFDQRVRQAQDQSLLTLRTIGLGGNAIPAALGTGTTATRQHSWLSLARRPPHAVHARPPTTQVAKLLSSCAVANNARLCPFLLRLPGTSFVMDSGRREHVKKGQGRC